MTEKVRNLREETLSDNWYTLKKITFDYQKKDGTWHTLSREAYDRGNGAVILLLNKVRKTVILTRQFRLPTYINGNSDGILIEACAGLLDREQPEVAIRRETEEETGYHVKDVRKILEVYMSPGSVTELLYFFIGEYSSLDKVNDGGGVGGEDIEVLELSFADALTKIMTGEIKDAKTIMLLYHTALHHLMD